MYVLTPPTYYNVAYSINPWMDTNIQPSNNFWDQWLDVYSAILNTGESVSLINPDPNLPDLVFAANYGSFIDDKFFLSTFKYQERAPEKLIVARWCVGNKITVTPMPDGICFEGDGDLVRTGNNLYAMGYGYRSDFEAAKFISEHTNKEIVPLKLCNPYFYHLDTCFMPIRIKEKTIILYYPGAFAEQSIPELFYQYTTIPVDSEEAHNFVCNSVSYHKNNQTVIIMSNKNARISKLLESYGCKVISINISEFSKAGGGVRCMVLHRQEN